MPNPYDDAWGLSGGDDEESEDLDSLSELEEDDEEDDLSPKDTIALLQKEINGLKAQISDFAPRQTQAQVKTETDTVTVDAEAQYAFARARAVYEEEFAEELRELIEDAGGEENLTKSEIEKFRERAKKKAIKAGNKEERYARSDFRVAQIEEKNDPHYNDIEAFKSRSPKLRELYDNPATRKIAKTVMKEVFGVANAAQETASQTSRSKRPASPSYIPPRSGARDRNIDDDDENAKMSSFLKAFKINLKEMKGGRRK